MSAGEIDEVEATKIFEQFAAICGGKDPQTATAATRVFLVALLCDQSASINDARARLSAIVRTASVDIGRDWNFYLAQRQTAAGSS